MEKILFRTYILALVNLKTYYLNSREILGLFFFSPESMHSVLKHGLKCVPCQQHHCVDLETFEDYVLDYPSSRSKARWTLWTLSWLSQNFFSRSKVFAWTAGSLNNSTQGLYLHTLLRLHELYGYNFTHIFRHAKLRRLPKSMQNHLLNTIM